MKENQRAIVVGASRGIGLGLVRELLLQQWSVIATLRDITRVPDDLKQLLAEYPDQLELAELDLSHLDTANMITSKYSEGSIDLLLVSAGIAGPEHQRVEQSQPNEIVDLFWVNSIAPVTIARKFLPLMKANSLIAFMSSRMGSVALNDDGSMELYRASKAALNSISRGFAQNEAIPLNIGVLNLHPGWVQTEMGGSQAPVTVKESTAGLVKVIQASIGSNQHKFIDFQGHEMAW
ncbi:MULTISPECIES: SDR family NAD(P)-dependent oxidoreductase [Acinetobacter]|uniref:SDR family NAD(P)-dependent oxidoreductase n=1 Tax=Acinetobacter TaxID=469 RepID=UPI000E5C3DC0|nr:MULTISPECIES: SDR family NAD(P)-dependent oxidoreductase [Acinetobacter]MBV6550891.1 SDR family NAD(P)-dependent oxidoreductase [Acinetobacter soli]MCL9675818.1 SDR family NAD(P)-dependent oxidoreductase [Acinetobacter sp. ACZLY 512]WEH92658.1 SDR family NAD(P)-dependent oxidoreductase [Acinetobacter soli]WEH98164.1 SDR family NAD(P)-dependent oxidoreductase [Acinetobacter soli]WEI01258.1 SDR family NAD(P)-dependent oxidoreductase [Acinetobacter soli]